MSAGKLIAEAATTGARVIETRLAAQIKSLKSEVAALKRETLLANQRAEIVSGLKAGRRAPKTIKYRKNLHRRVATPVLLCSDWHVGERVVASKVNHVNAYDQHEAAHRAHRLATALTWLIEHHRHSFEIRECVIWLGGDLITGYLHPDQQQSNTLPPNKEVLLVQDLVGNLLDQVLALPGMERVIVPCSYGNHGRTTHKPQIATGAENSFEWLLYQQLARDYADESRAEFQIASGEFTRLRIHKTDLGFTHGDVVKYGGGVGGIMVPVMRAMPRWQTYGHCDVWNMGHFHSYYDTPIATINGSLIGAAPYGMRVGGYENPIQAMYMIDSKRGKCQSSPIWVTGGRK